MRTSSQSLTLKSSRPLASEKVSIFLGKVMVARAEDDVHLLEAKIEAPKRSFESFLGCQELKQANLTRAKGGADRSQPLGGVNSRSLASRKALAAVARTRGLRAVSYAISEVKIQERHPREPELERFSAAQGLDALYSLVQERARSQRRKGA